MVADAGFIFGAAAETVGTAAGWSAGAGASISLATDAYPCVTSALSSTGNLDSTACGGAAMGAVSLGYGGSGSLFARTLPEGVKPFLDMQSLLLGTGGWGLDLPLWTVHDDAGH